MTLRTHFGVVAFLLGAAVGGLAMFLALQATAASSILTPSLDGITNDGAQGGTCDNSSNYSCIDDGSSTSSAPTGSDYINQSRDQEDYFQMGPTLSGVATTSVVHVSVYHLEGNGNMQVEVSLWNATEDTEISAAPVLLTNRTSIAGWNSATFSGLQLDEDETNAMRVRIACRRPSGGRSSTCFSYAMFATAVYSEAVDIVVSSTGSQKNLLIGTTSAHVGGAFVMDVQSGSRDIEEITLTESGSVNAASHLDNVELYYETAADCSTETYNGTETQYGSTDGDGGSGFSGADGTITFSESPGISVSAANDMCVYAVVDVLSGAVFGQDIELAIADPSTDVVGSGSANIDPDTEVALSGTTVLQAVNLVQSHYHWRNESGGETASNALTTNDDEVLDTAAANSSYRLRMQVQNTGNISSDSTQYRLQYGTRVTTCGNITAGNWYDLGSGMDWDMTGTGSGLTEGNNTTNVSEANGGVADGTGSFVGTGGQKTTSATTTGVSLPSTDYYEFEYAITADAGVTEGTNYCFRVLGNSTALQNYTSYPRATIAADMLVAATGTQPLTADIGTTVNSAGGFVITDSTAASSHTIDSFTVTASSTGDLQDGIDNITLWYETDTVAPLDCTGERFDGDETQYGAVDTNGFSANGTSTFTESPGPTVSTSQALCFYVEYDVTASSSNGERIEFRIANPVTDIVPSDGSVSPAALVDITGDTQFLEPIVSQEHYHWRNNLGNEAGASSAVGGEDTLYQDLPRESVVRLRMGIANTGGTTTSAMQFQLEWAQRVSTCAEVAEANWYNVDIPGDDWSTSTSLLVENGDTTDISPAAGGVSNVGSFLGTNSGQQEDDDITDPTALPANNFIEIEYAIEAADTATEGASYCFRITDNGTPLDSYGVYARATLKLATDFKIQRGTTTIESGQTTVTISQSNGDYENPSSASNAFIRIINAHHTGRGPAAGTTANLNASDVTAGIVNPGDFSNGITFQRSGTSNDTLIMWEIIEYTGAASGENEIIVRGQGTSTYTTTGTTVSTPTIGGVSDDADVVVFITGQQNPNSGRNNYNTGLSTAAWNGGSNIATFTRNEAGGDAIIVSYAVVEFTGTNWNVQRREMVYDANYTPGNATTSPISAVDPDKTFLHAQHRTGSDTHADFGHEVWLSSMGQVSFRLNGAVTNETTHASVAWVVENTQNVGDVMEVHQESNTITGSGGGLTNAYYTIGTTVEDLSVAGIFFNGSSGGTSRSFPEPMMSVQLISDTQFLIQVTDDSETMQWQAQVVEWPTAARKLTQDDYQFFYDDDTLDPTDPWPQGGTVDIGENQPLNENYTPLASGQNVRMRINLLVSAAAMAPGVDAFLLEYGESAGSCAAIGEADWHPIGDTASTTAIWRGHAGAQNDGDTLGTNLLDTTTVLATYEENNPSALTPNLAVVNDVVEFDWNIEHNGAKDKTEYCFRMVESDGTSFGVSNYNTYPTIVTAGYGPVIGNWRFYDDEDTLPPVVALGTAENEAPTDIGLDNILKLRLTLAEKSGADGVNPKFALQYSEDPSFSVGVYDVVASSTCAFVSTTTANIWCYADAAGADNQVISDKVISDADSCSGGSGAGCGLHNEGTTTPPTGYTHSAFTNAEFEFALRNDGARANAVYYFRLYDTVHDEVVTASSAYPSLQIEGPQLSFTLGGMPVGTTSEGVTSDIETTPTSVPFGSVPFDTEFEGIYRLRVNTTATEGYQLLMYARQPMVHSSYGVSIPDIAATNDTPTDWTSGCDTLPACFGYHAGDDILANGSTRFSADDTYAAFSSTPEEVMYSSVPTEDLVDIVYKIQVSEMQPAGEYETEVVYLAIPSF